MNAIGRIRAKMNHRIMAKDGDFYAIAWGFFWFGVATGIGVSAIVYG